MVLPYMNSGIIKNKYRNRKIVMNGIQFDSVKEYERYLELSILQKTGIIKNLERQKRYEIIPKQKTLTGKKERKTEYIADFVYYDIKTEKTIVEDVKGYKKGQAYQLFVIKRKLMLQRYGIEVKEV